MKRNLLIGTSLVAAFSATSLDARSFSVMTEESRKENTALSSAIHMVTEGHKRATSKTPLKAGATDAFAAVYQAVVAKVTPGKDGKVSLADVTAALVTDVELRKLVADFRPAVVAAVAAEQNKAPKPGPTPESVPAPVVVVETEATIETLTQAVVNTTDALTTAIIAEGVAQKAVADTTADEAAAQKVKADADTALTAAQTALKAAETKAAAAKEAVDKATADLTALTTEKKVKEEAIAASEKAIADKTAAGTAVTPAETDALAVLKAELGTIDAKIAAATTAQTDTAAALVVADKAVADAKAVVETTTKAQADAVAALEAAEKAQADAVAALIAKTTAATEATTKLATEKDALLTVATTAATAAATKAVDAQAAYAAAELTRQQLATAAATAAGNVKLAEQKQKRLNAELESAKESDEAASTAETKAAVSALHAKLKADAAEFEAAKAKLHDAGVAHKNAVAASHKAKDLVESATEAKTTTAAAVKAAQDAVKAADDAVKTAKATVAQAAEKAKADALAAKTKADAAKADAAEAKADAELVDLEAKLTATPGDAALTAAIAAKKTELAELKTAAEKAAVEAATADKAADKAASDLAAKEAELATAALSAKALTDQLTAAQTAAAEAAARVAALEDAGTKSAIEVSGLTADKDALTATVDGFNADLVVENLIERTKAEWETAVEARQAASETIDNLIVDTIDLVDLVDEDDVTAYVESDEYVSLAEALEGQSFAGKRSYVAKELKDRTAALKAYETKLADANKIADEVAKAAAIADLGEAPTVDARLEKLVAAMDAFVVADLEVKAAESFLDTVSRLRYLMEQATVEGAGEGTLSGKLAARLNANVAAQKAQLVADLNRAGRPVGIVVAEAVEKFNVLADEVRQFNELKTLFDIDARVNAKKDDAVTAQLKRIVAELQATVDSSVTVDAVSKVEKLVAAVQQRLATAWGLERFAEIESSRRNDGDAPRRAQLIVDAAAHLETLQRALSDASDTATNTIAGLMRQLAQVKELSDRFAELTQSEAAEKARFAGLGDAEKEDEATKAGHQEILADLKAHKGRLLAAVAPARRDGGRGRVQNLTADAVAQLQSALFDYTAFLAELEKASDFDLVDADTIDQVFATKSESGAKGFAEFKARIRGAVPHGVDIDVVSREFSHFVANKGREAAQQARSLAEKLAEATAAFDAEYGAVKAAAHDSAVQTAYALLTKEVVVRERAIADLTARNAALTTAKATATPANRVGIQENIDNNTAQITELTTWLTDNAEEIAAAKTVAAPAIALNALQFLQREVADRQPDIARLTAENARLTAAKAAATDDDAAQADLQRQIEANTTRIAELTTWFTDNATKIAAATAEAGKLATLDAEVTALRAQSTALRADFAKTSEERAADTRALQTLTHAVRQARAAKVEENAAFVADLEDAVATILSPAPVVVAEFKEDADNSAAAAASATAGVTPRGFNPTPLHHHENHPSADDAEALRLASGLLSGGLFGAPAPAAGTQVPGGFGGTTTMRPLTADGTPSRVGFGTPPVTDGTDMSPARRATLLAERMRVQSAANTAAAAALLED